MIEQRVFGAWFRSPVLLASGTCGYGQEYADLIDLESLGGLVTKAVSLEPRPGNAPHRVAETAGGMVNAIGLENPGLAGFIATKLPWLRDNLSKAQVLVNVVGRSVDDYAAVVRGLDGEDGFLGYEINVSCPNVKGGTMFGTNPAALAELVRRIRGETDRPLIVKLTPNVADVGEFAMVCEEEGADGLSAINTFPGMVVDTASRRPLIGNRSGGVSGPAILPMGVHATWRARQCSSLPVIGVGGIRSALDAMQYIMAGACLVQVGTASFVDPMAAVRVSEGLAALVEAAPERSIGDLVGSLDDA
ncbi:MAG: dihydroorotate dehydrogenase [Gemmatimonadetes bacterium]|nr:dihydroorotate dehydrogenase [Gemmatimonadota bacterium]